MAMTEKITRNDFARIEKVIRLFAVGKQNYSATIVPSEDGPKFKIEIEDSENKKTNNFELNEETFKLLFSDLLS